MLRRSIILSALGITATRLDRAIGADLKPEFATCKNGHHQSPIDIRNPKKAALPLIQFDYKPSPLHIIDNDHTVMINYGPGSSITVADKKYAVK